MSLFATGDLLAWNLGLRTGGLSAPRTGLAEKKGDKNDN
jgi:hypothetical protein